VIVELNPQDKKLLETLTTASLQGVHLEAVPQLASGSVRVIANDMVVEDLIENRLEALARSLVLKEITPRSEQVVEKNKNQENSLKESSSASPAIEEPKADAKIQLRSVEFSEEILPEVSGVLSFEPPSEVDEQVKQDDGEAEDVHS
jgi:hypothetical protein